MKVHRWYYGSELGSLEFNDETKELTFQGKTVKAKDIMADANDLGFAIWKAEINVGRRWFKVGCTELETCCADPSVQEIVIHLPQ